jgi:hypothetical protein
MLTILHRQPDGGEVLFPAHRIECLQPDGEQCVPAIGNRFIVWGEDCPDRPGGPFEITIEAPFGAVFVMNKHGSTVARYLARQLGCEAATQADPSALAEAA